ncbi:MAG: hypothetical protein ACHQRO_03865 [Vicinamibacteria bacterium]|jgi:hypothetical protein
MAVMPLLECFIRGDVDPEVSLLAAQGALAPRADEQLAILVYLVTHDETHVATVANQTIASLPVEAVAGLIARKDTSEKVLEFFAARGIVPGAVATEDTDAPLVDTGEEPEAVDPAKVPLHALTVPQRLKMAMKGSREQRAVLVRDNNRMIAAAVLSSPKLAETEVEAFARMANVSEDVLRTISMNRSWMRRQAVATALVKNPKTPATISLFLLPRMQQRDVKNLAIDRNVPEALRLNAKKMMQRQEDRQK